MNSPLHKTYLTLIACAIMFSGCAQDQSESKAKIALEPINRQADSFCHVMTEQDRGGGGMYKMSGEDHHVIGNCSHAMVDTTNVVVIFFGDRSEDLLDELDEHVNPLHYYTDAEAAEMLCSPGSHCEKSKLMAEQARLLAEKQAEEARSVVKQTSATLLFDSGMAEPKDKDVLSLVAKRAAGRPIRIYVTGHTDSVGSDKFNDKLSMKRAKRIRQILVANGVDEKNIAVIGRGEKDPVDSNDTKEGRAKNRRAAVQGVVNGDGN